MKFIIILIFIFCLMINVDADISLPPMGMQDEGGTVSRPVTVIDCVGAGVSCAQSGYTGTVTVVGVSGWTDDGSIVRLTTASDNVGIGRSNPSAKLHIFGAGTGTGFALRIADTTPTDRLVVLDNGNVGIGLTNPSYKFQVAGTGAMQVLRFGTNYDNLLPGGTGAANQILKTNATGSITWQADADTGGGGSTRVMFPLSIAGLKISGTDISTPLRIDAGDSTWKALGNQSSPMYGLWVIQLPTNYTATPTLRLGVTAASNPGGNLVISADVQRISDGDTVDIDIPSYDNLNTVGQTMPANAGYLEIVDVPLTNFDSSSTPGDILKIRVQRDADSTDDTLTGDIEFRSAAFLYDRN